MSKPLTAAEAWCWAAHMYSAEDSALTYKYPRTPEDEAQAAIAQAQGDACYERATKLDAGEGLWQRALAKWETP